MTKPVLILGGTGQAGRGSAELLRRWYPDLPLTIAGRDLDRAQQVAAELGGATAVTVDVERADLGLPADLEHSAVVAALWDSRLNGLHHAQDRRIPYLSISSGLVDVAPEIVLAAQRPGAAPILVASHCFAGVLTLAALHAARELGRVDSVRIGAVLDETDVGGPAAVADLERLEAATTAGLQRRGGVFTWTDEAGARVQVPTVDGTLVAGQAVAILDVPSIAFATGAQNVRFDFAVGESAGRRRTGRPSIEVLIEIEGAAADGAPRRIARHLVHRDGQQPLTALGIALGAEGLLGLRGAPVAAGIHMPESLVEPAHAAARLAEIGAELVEAGALVARE
jgi:hypothetical protein